jgi:hypothetical protein
MFKRNQARILRLPGLRLSMTLRKASLIRLCQPVPLFLKKATTSLSSRIVVCTLVGDFCGPRPFLGSGRSNCASTSRAGLALRNVAPVHSGFSSSILLMIKFSLLELCSSQADHTNAIFADGKDQNMNTAVDHADCKPSFLAIVEPFICNDKGGCPVKILNNFEADSVFVQIGRIFHVIPFVFILLLQNNFQAKLFAHGTRT